MPDTPSVMEVRHLEREIKTALELALAALAPAHLIEKLATTAGLLGAVLELPQDSPPAVTWTRDAFQRAKLSLAEWLRWEDARKAMA